METLLAQLNLCCCKLFCLVPQIKTAAFWQHAEICMPYYRSTTMTSILYPRRERLPQTFVCWFWLMLLVYNGLSWMILGTWACGCLRTWTWFDEILKGFSFMLLTQFVLLLYEIGTTEASPDLLALTGRVWPYRRSWGSFRRPQQVAVINTNKRVPTCSYRVAQKNGDKVLREVPWAGSEPNLTTTATRRWVRLFLMNCHSSRNKADVIVDHIISHDLDLLALTETWLKPAETAGDRDARIVGDLHHFCRPLFPECPQAGKRARQWCRYSLQVYSFKVDVERIETYHTFEYMVAHFSCGAQSRGTVVIICTDKICIGQAGGRDYPLYGISWTSEPI